VRAYPARYNLVTPGDLPAALALLADDPEKWLPIAGGTELMVLFSAGRLPQHNLINLWNLTELTRIQVQQDAVIIGGGCTFAQIRSHPVIASEFPLLVRAATWIGGIANQNRATLAGNLANASPAADSSPALLACVAEIELISVRGSRRLPYADFHLSYKRTALMPGELIYAIHLPRRFAGWCSYSRKVGARNAQAISKVCIAAQARIVNNTIQKINIGIGSVAPVPLQLTELEQLLMGCSIDNFPVKAARQLLNAAITPIDDIRSTTEYRRHVAGNLLEECLQTLTKASQ
jgi:CO/xanthine dehydrogenase FAD-binding subunit